MFHLLEYVGRCEFLVVIDKYRRAHYPLSVELSPHGFSPSCIGNGKVQTVEFEVVPESSSTEMSESVCIVMNHHLGLAARSAGEVHDGIVGCFVQVLWSLERCCLFDTFLEIFPTFAYFGTDADASLHGRALRIGMVHVVEDFLIATSDDSLDGRLFAAVNDVFGSEQERCRNNDCTNLMECDDAGPKFESALQNEHHHVALSNAEALEKACHLVRFFLQLLEGETSLLFFVVGPKKCQFVGSFFCPCVHHVVSKIEVLRYDEFKVLFKILHRGEGALLQKTF